MRAGVQELITDFVLIFIKISSDKNVATTPQSIQFLQYKNINILEIYLPWGLTPLENPSPVFKSTLQATAICCNLSISSFILGRWRGSIWSMEPTKSKEHCIRSYIKIETKMAFPEQPVQKSINPNLYKYIF